MASGSSLYDTRNPKPLLCDNLEGWEGEEGGRDIPGEGTCMPNTDSCRCMAKTFTILLRNYPIIKKKFKKQGDKTKRNVRGHSPGPTLPI